MIPLEDMLSPRGVHAVDFLKHTGVWRAYYWPDGRQNITSAYEHIDGATPREAVEKAYAQILTNRLTE